MNQNAPCQNRRCQICGETFDGNVEHHGKDAPAAMGGIPKHGFQPAEPPAGVADAARLHGYELGPSMVGDSTNPQSPVECSHKALLPDGGWPQCITLGGSFWFHCVYCDDSIEVTFLPADVVERLEGFILNTKYGAHKWVDQQHLAKFFEWCDTLLAALPKEGE